MTLNAIQVLSSLADIERLLDREKDECRNYMHDIVIPQTMDIMELAQGDLSDVGIEDVEKIIEIRAKSEEKLERMKFLAELSEKMAELTHALCPTNKEDGVQ
jgi:DNA-binding transcriptional MerR regulator